MGDVMLLPGGQKQPMQNPNKTINFINHKQHDWGVHIFMDRFRLKLPKLTEVNFNKKEFRQVGIFMLLMVKYVTNVIKRVWKKSWRPVLSAV
eukprot:UN33273